MPVPITPKPTTPRLITGDELYANLRACVLLTEASGDPAELVTGHAAVWPGEGGHTGHGTITTGPWGKQRAFLAGDSSVNWGAGSGIPTATAGKASCGVIFRVPATTAFTDTFYGLAGSTALSIGGIYSGGLFYGYALYGGGNNHNVQMNFTMGHDYGVVLVVDGTTSAGSGMPGTLYWLDYTDQTAGIQSGALASGDTRTLADFTPGANADAFGLNSTAYNGTNNPGFPIVAAALWNGALTAQMVADYLADPSRMARVALTATPPSVGAGGSGTVRIGANAPVLGANSGAAVVISLASSGQSTPGGKTGQTWVDASDIDVAITDGSAGTLIFSEPNYGASVNVTVSSAAATGYSITPSTSTPVVGSAFNVVIALTGGVTSANTTIALTTTDGLGSFSSSPVVLNTGVPSVTVTYTAGTAGAATLTATATVNPASYTSPRTASINSSASGLQAPVVTLVKAGWTSNDVSIAQPAGGSGGIARIELHRLPRYETTPSGATLIHTFTAPTFPIAYTITGLTANTPAIFTYIAFDGGGQSAGTPPQATYGWEFPTPKIHLWIIGQSHMANMPSMSQMFDVGETGGGTTSPNVVPQPTGDGTMFRMTQTNSGAGATSTTEWLPTAPGGYLAAGHAAAVTAAAAAGATEVWMIAEFGHNQINHPNPPADTVTELTTIFDWVRANPVVAGAPHYFLVLSPIPAQLDPSFTKAQLSTLLIEIRAALKGMDNGTDVFFFGDDLLGMSLAHSEFYETTFYQHLTLQPGGYSQSGYQVLAGLIADGLKRIRLRKAGLITDVGGISPPPPPPPPSGPAPPVGIDWTKTSDI